MGKKSKRIRAKQATAASSLPWSNVHANYNASNWREKLERERPNNVAAIVEGILTRWTLDENETLSLQASQAALAECRRLESSLFSLLQRADDVIPLYDTILCLMKIAPPSVPAILERPVPAYRKDNELNCSLSLWKVSLFQRRDPIPAALALRYLLSFPPERHGTIRAFLLAAWLGSLTRNIHGGYLAEDMVSLVDPFLDGHAKNQLRQISKNESEPILCRVLALAIRSTIARDPRIYAVAPLSAPTTEEAYCLRRACRYMLDMESDDWIVDKSGLEKDLQGINISEEDLNDGLMKRLIAISYNWNLRGTEFHLLVDKDEAALDEAHICYAKTLGGLYCDNCRELMPDFSSCSCCRLSHYCSAECQRIAWESGHKDHCTPLGVFTKGDAAILQRLGGDEARLNGTIVQVKDEVGRGLYSVLIPDDDELRVETINRKNLRHIRPAA